MSVIYTVEDIQGLPTQIPDHILSARAHPEEAQSDQRRTAVKKRKVGFSQ